MPQRKYNKNRSDVTKTNKRITLPITLADYNACNESSGLFREKLDAMIAAHPELFPADINQGYVMHGTLPASEKLPEVRYRRIKLKTPDSSGKAQIFSIISSDVMPYMVGYTDEVEKALFLRRFSVPYWALSYVFGHNDNYWFRMVSQFGRNELVSTVVKDSEALPKNLLADEKHTNFNGEKAYIATTVGEDCILGVSLTLSANEAELTEGYNDFKQEAQRIDKNYSPETVNTDGWAATQKAWKALFTKIILIECFLHCYLKIKDRCKNKWKEVFSLIQKKVWDTYHSIDAEAFIKNNADLLLWATQTLTGPALEAVQKLCAKVDLFVIAYDYPNAHRTSNMVDRHMEPLDRWLHDAKYFHGNWASAQLQIRAWALFHDFLPYSPRAITAGKLKFHSPVEKLNGFVYHENWLHNLLISTSCSGCPRNHRIRQN